MSEQLTIKEVKVDVHQEVYEGFRVKVLLPDIGMFINGVRVYPPNPKHPDKWVVYTPEYGERQKGKRPKRAVEFSSKLPLWHMVVEACIEAIKEYTAGDPTSDYHSVKDVVLDDIDDAPIDLSLIPY